MSLLFTYSIKSSICLIAFYLFYKLLLSRDTFFRFNRLTLLGMMVLSLLLPWIADYFHPVFKMELFPDMVSGPLDTLIGEPLALTPAITLWDRFLSTLLFGYVAGCCLVFLWSLRTLYRIFRIVRSGEMIRLDKHIRLTIHANPQIVPFSWLNFIAVSHNDMQEAGQTILKHEQAHIRRFHTLDLLFAELNILFGWYNPAAWLLYRELQQIHEFEADLSVLQQGVDAKQYQLLLIKKAVGTRLFSMANSFNHSNLKKRITMMLQKKSSPWARLKYAYVLPLAAIGMIALARPEISRTFEGISNAKVSNLFAIDKQEEAGLLSSATPPPTLSIAIQQSDSVVFEFVEEMPKFPGGMDVLFQFITDNLQYPKEAQDKGIQGRVIVNFIVETDGSTTNFTVIRSIDSLLDAEAIRVLSKMPKWIPGKQRGHIVRVQYAVPIVFRLQN